MVEKQENEKVFGFYLYLPTELRIMIVDEMEPADRCRFSRCSGLCYGETRVSKNYIFELKLARHCESCVRIYVIHWIDRRTKKKLGFILEIKNMFDYKCIAYLNMEAKELWENRLENSTDLLKYAAEHFKKLLQFYQNTVKNLIIEGKVSETDIDFGIHSLKNLKELKVSSDIDIRQFFSKIQHPLKKLVVEGKKNGEIIATWEQTYKVQHLYTPHAKFNYDQYRRLTGKTVLIHIGSLTEYNIRDFVKSWQNGEIGQNFMKYGWSLEGDTDFNVDEYIKLMKIPENGRLRIQHLKDFGKSAKLFCIPDRRGITKIGFIAGLLKRAGRPRASN